MSDSRRTRKRARLSKEVLYRLQMLRYEANRNLISDLQGMVNQDDYVDVIFICNDGERVKGIRSLLVARCNVLKGMLANGMKETSLSEINLPDVSSQALLCVFDFLYTGMIGKHQPKVWRLLIDVLVAARFFLLFGLVGIVLQLILGKILEVSHDLPEVAAMLTLVLEFNNCCQRNECDVIIWELVEILSSSWTDSTYVDNLSEEALHYLLSHTKPENNYKQVHKEDKNNEGKPLSRDKRRPSLVEYHRFRQVIRWWAYQNVPEWSRQVEDRLESVVPLIQDTSSLDLKLIIDDETASANASLSLKSLLNTSKDAAARLLSAIDLRYMHLILIEKVIAPLECFSSSDLLRVFRFHALDKIVRSIGFNYATCGWKYGSSLTTCGAGSSIKNRGISTGSAIALRQISPQTRIHLWRFVVEEAVNVIVEVGFIFVSTAKVSGFDERDFDHKILGHLSDAKLSVTFAVTSAGKRVVIDGIDRQGKSSRAYKPIDETISRGSHILFQLDFVEHNCSLNLNGKDFGICWENLPDRDCYPAVSLKVASKSPDPPCGIIGIQAPWMKSV